MEHLRAYFDRTYGSRSKLAAALNITPSAITQWKSIPPEHVLKVSEITGITPALLRPDMYEGMERVA